MCRPIQKHGQISCVARILETRNPKMKFGRIPEIDFLSAIRIPEN